MKYVGNVLLFYFLFFSKRKFYKYLLPYLVVIDNYQRELWSTFKYFQIHWSSLNIPKIIPLIYKAMIAVWVNRAP